MRQRARSGIRRLLVSTLGAWGYGLAPMPAWVQAHPEAELRLSLEYVLAHYLTRINPTDLFFVQIGAFDGKYTDPLYALVRKYGWRGLLVEPRKQPFCALLENYRDQPQLRFENVAIADKDEVRKLYTIRDDVPGLPRWTQGLASFEREHLLRHRDSVPNIADLVTVEEVSCLTLESLVRRHNIERVDLLQIDAEGYDWEIIKRINFERICPSIIHYEHSGLSRKDREASVAFLAARGYRIGIETIDTLAYRV